jgi:hypothetical protein
VTLITGVTKHLLITLKTIGLLILHNISMSSKRFITLFAGEVLCVVIVFHCFGAFLSEDETPNNETDLRISRSMVGFAAKFGRVVSAGR